VMRLFPKRGAVLNQSVAEGSPVDEPVSGLKCTSSVVSSSTSADESSVSEKVVRIRRTRRANAGRHRNPNKLPEYLRV
jgi:hypothetical protein